MNRKSPMRFPKGSEPRLHQHMLELRTDYGLNYKSLATILTIYEGVEYATEWSVRHWLGAPKHPTRVRAARTLNQRRTARAHALLVP